MLAYTTYAVFGGGILSLPLLHYILGLLVLLCSAGLRKRVPITGRSQILLRDSEYMVTAKNRNTAWLKSFISKPRLPFHDQTLKTVQAVLDQVSKADPAQGYDFKLVVWDYFSSKFGC